MVKCLPTILETCCPALGGREVGMALATLGLCVRGPRNTCPSKGWVQSLGQEDPLEKEMASHSSTLA